MLTQEKNLKILDQRISSLDLKGKEIIALDFDELVVPIHLTRGVLKQVSQPTDKSKLKKLGSCSFEGILYLNSLAYGYDSKKYETIRDNLSKKTSWREDFDKIIRDLLKRYSVIFISSGMKDISESKLKELNFNPKNILASEFEIKGGKIAGSKLIISEELKGYIIKKLKETHKVVAVGHSSGDKLMLSNADVSISIGSDLPDLAEYNLKRPEEILKIIC